MTTNTNRIFIYHVNDFHSHLNKWPKIVAYLKRQRAIHEKDGDEMLLLDIGDHIDRSHPITEATMGKANSLLLQEAGFQYVTLGNNEGLTIGKEDLHAIYKEAEFKVLCCNLTTSEESKKSFIKPYAVHKTKNGEIGIIGATFPYYKAYSKLGWNVEEPVKAIKRAVKELKHQGVNQIILLSHLGNRFDDYIAENIDGIDLLLGAHTHHHYPEGKKIKNTFLGAAYKYGEYVGRVIVENGCIQELQTINVTETEEDEETSLLLHSLKAQSDELLEERITFIPHFIKADWFEENEAIKLVAKSIMEWTDTNVCAIFSGICMKSVEKGWLTKKELHEFLPHPINPAIIKMKGKYIIRFFDECADEEFQRKTRKGLGFRGKVFGYLHKEGFSRKHDRWYIHEEKIRLDKEYEFAVLDLVTFGPIFPYINKNAEITYFLPEMLRDIFEWEVKKEYR